MPSSYDSQVAQISASSLGVPRLYHYRRLDRDEHLGHLADLLREGTARFSDPATINDPWDCRAWFSVPNPDDPAERELCLESLKSMGRQARLREGEPVDEAQLDKEADDMRRFPESFQQFADGMTEQFSQAVREQYRIFCLTLKPDHPLMWAHYAHSHRGVCLQFGGEELLSVAYRVRYSKEFPALHLGENTEELLIRTLLTKAKVWCYEEEYRIINREGTGCQNGFATMPTRSLQAIIVGCQMPPDQRRNLQWIVEQSGANVELKQAVLVHGRYALDIGPL